jgi:tetratricopeptide (TPR) repeat protein
MQRPRDAQRALERAIAIAPDLLPAREQLADLHAASGNRAGRIRQLEALFEADPRAGRQLALAAAYAEANQTTRAVRLLGNAAERYPDQADTYVALGRIWADEARNGDHVALAKAIEALQHAASIEPTSRALGLLGEAQLMGEDPRSPKPSSARRPKNCRPTVQLFFSSPAPPNAPAKQTTPGGRCWTITRSARPRTVAAATSPAASRISPSV